MITQEMIDRFYAKKAQALETKTSSGSPYEKEEYLLNELITGRRTLWVEVLVDGKMIYFPVYTLDELKAVTHTYPAPCLMAVKAGFDLATAYELEEEQRDKITKLDDCYTLWVGDFDEHGAECGIIMDILLPHSPNTPCAMTQELIDRHESNESNQNNTSNVEYLSAEDLKKLRDNLYKNIKDDDNQSNIIDT